MNTSQKSPHQIPDSLFGRVTGYGLDGPGIEVRFPVGTRGTVVYRPVVKRWLCKQRPLLGNIRSIHARNNRITMFSVVCAEAVATQRRGKRISAATSPSTTMEELCFLCDRCLDAISKGQSQFRDFCKGIYEERAWASEPEEYPLLEAVARERLVKTQQAGKSLACGGGDLWIVESSDGAVIACSAECCV
jgi:hypothetical protein